MGLFVPHFHLRDGAVVVSPSINRLAYTTWFPILDTDLIALLASFVNEGKTTGIHTRPPFRTNPKVHPFCNFRLALCNRTDGTVEKVSL